MTKEIKINGNLVTEKALAYKSEWLELTNNFKTILLNLSNVKNVDIVGINALVTTHKKLQDKGGELVILIPKEGELRKLLHLTKFDSILTLK